MPNVYCGHVEVRRRRAHRLRRLSLRLLNNDHRNHHTHGFDSDWVEDIYLWQGEDIGATQLDCCLFQGVRGEFSAGGIGSGCPEVAGQLSRGGK